MFGKMLQGSGVCNCLLPGNLPDVSASIDRHDWRHKPLGSGDMVVLGVPGKGPSRVLGHAFALGAETKFSLLGPVFLVLSSPWDCQ